MSSIKKIIFIYLLLISNLHSAPLMEFIKNVDWEFFADKTKFSLDLCACDIFEDGKGAGFKLSVAEPIGVIETTNTPWNIVALQTKFQKSVARKQGKSRENGDNKRYTHFVAFPIMAALNFMQDYICFERVSFLSFLYWSEIVPTANNDILALFTELARGPISKAWYNNPFGMLACSVDCAATTFHEPLNSLHWCAGCAGVTGNNTGFGAGKDPDPLMNAHVQALSAIDQMHLIGSLSKVSNARIEFSPVAAIPNTMCGPKYFPLGLKTQYYLQLIYPTIWDATTIGKFAPMHALFKNKPNAEDDVAMWLWSIKDTCAGGAKCKSMLTRETNNNK
ncbi:TraU family protein (plasmid) [Aliarcobacter lanthieri]|uniref:TraU family protein n=1 Tax=Aliarcobacter lanthieri TaxID=1355374 RepID=UPI003AAA7240